MKLAGDTIGSIKKQKTKNQNDHGIASETRDSKHETKNQKVIPVFRSQD